MAQIIVSAMSNVTWLREPYVDSFVEGMIRALTRAGNEVLNIRVNDFYRNGKLVTSRERMRKKIHSFKPDLVLSLNNAAPYPQFIDDTDCPVACLAADSYAFFSNKETIRKHAERYYFFNFSNDTINTLKDWFPEAQANRNILFGHATDLQAEDIPQDIPVSFVGSMANWNRELVAYFQRLPHIPVMNYEDQNTAKNSFFKLLDQFKDNPFMEVKGGAISGAPLQWGVPVEASLIHLLTCQERFKVLSQLSDLGLRLYGYPHAYSEVLLYNEKLFRCFDYTPSVTIDHSTHTFNRSKVSLNLPHGHAQEGFSWRVCDILASNATLLSCRQPDLVSLSKGYVDLPMFESPAEARDLTIKLLRDPEWRKELSKGSQKMIEEKCRFEPKFKIMEEVISGLTLFSDVPGAVEWMDGSLYCDYIKLNKEKFFRHTRNTLLKIINREITIREAVRAVNTKVGRTALQSLSTKTSRK